MYFTPLFASVALDVQYDEANAWLYLDWKGPQTLAGVQASTQHVSALIARTNCHKALNDNSRVTQTSWELMRWLAAEYLPATGRLGLDYVAWVYSSVLVCRSDLDQMALLLAPRPHVALFEDVASAYAWLASPSIPTP